MPKSSKGGESWPKSSGQSHFIMSIVGRYDVGISKNAFGQGQKEEFRLQHSSLRFIQAITQNGAKIFEEVLFAEKYVSSYSLGIPVNRVT